SRRPPPPPFPTAGGLGPVPGPPTVACPWAKPPKPKGPIGLGLPERVHSVLFYPAAADIRRMVARSAYAQLRYSPLLLLAMMALMALTFLVPPLATIFGSDAARWIGAGGWALMFVAFQPTLRFYRLSPLWGL